MSSLPNSHKDFVAISINSDVSYPPSSKLYCNLCSCNLTLLDAQEEEWFCTRCNISYFPSKGEKVKRANKFETPGPLTDSHGNITGEKMPLLSMVDDTPRTHPKGSMSKYFKEIERRGLKITNYTTTEER
jgi:hypothetical protein